MGKKFIFLLCVISILPICFPCAFAAEETGRNTGIKRIVSDEQVVLDQHGNVLYDLGEIYRFGNITVKTKTTLDSGIEKYEVYFSLDGNNYNKVGSVQNTNPETGVEMTLVYDVAQDIRARYVKIKVNYQQGKALHGISNIEIYGMAAEKEQKIEGASYTWSKKQPFVTEFDITEVDTAGKNMLTDGNLEALCQTRYEYATAIFDLKRPYQIGTINVWSKADSEWFMDGYEVKYSLDGKTYFSYGFFANKNPRNSNDIVNTAACGLPGKNARYIKLVMHTSSSMAIGEVQIYGFAVDNQVPQKAGVPDQVTFTTKLKNYVICYLDWSAYNTEANDVSKFSVYLEKSDFNNVSGLVPYAQFEKFTEPYVNKFYSCYPLEPLTTYYIAITPSDKNGVERKDVKTVKVTTPGALGEKPEDIFCINHYPERSTWASQMYGSYGEQNVDNILDLISELGNIQKNRWYSQDSDMIKRYNERGLGYLLMFDGGYNNVRNCNNNGVWMFSSGNEYDLRNDVTPAQYLEQVRRVSSLVRDIDSRNIISEPAISSTMDSSLNWVENLYKSDGANGRQFSSMFDVFDLHAYCKIMDGTLPGIDGYGYPEVLPSKLEKLRAVLAKFGDEKKPMIFSEMGWCTNPYQNYMRNVDGIKQRDYIVRFYMIAIAEGIREAYLYELQDNGVKKLETEDNYGIIDWFGVPKPAYYGYYILSSLMQNTEYVGACENVNHPYYGYEFWNESKNSYLTSLWAADDGVKTAEISTVSGDSALMVLGTDGSYKYIPVVNGIAQVTISGAPIFIYSKGGIKVNSIDSAFTLQSPTQEYTRGQDLTLNVIRNKKGEGMSGSISCSLPKGWSVVSSTNFDKISKTIPVKIHISTESEEGEQNVGLNLMLEDGSKFPLTTTLKVKNSLNVSVVPELPEIGNWNRWEAGICLENCVDTPLSGEILISGCDGLNVKAAKAMHFTQLKPHERQKFTIEFEGMPQKVGANLTILIKMDGYEKTVNRVLNYAACVNDGVTPVIDGVISKGEWDGTMSVGPNRPADGVERTDMEKNNIDFKAYRKWDEQNLYLLVDVTDNIHFQTNTGDSIWQGDSVQFSFDPGRKDGIGSTAFHEMGVALNSNDNSITNWRWIAPKAADQGNFASMKSAVKRNGTHTIYEVAIPWSDLVGNKKVTAGDIFGFSIVANDNDGSGRAGILEYMGGIAIGGKNPNLFDDMLLIKK